MRLLANFMQVFQILDLSIYGIQKPNRSRKNSDGRHRMYHLSLLVRGRRSIEREVSVYGCLDSYTSFCVQDLGFDVQAFSSGLYKSRLTGMILRLSECDPPSISYGSRLCYSIPRCCGTSHNIPSHENTAVDAHALDVATF